MKTKHADFRKQKEASISVASQTYFFMASCALQLFFKINFTSVRVWAAGVTPNYKTLIQINNSGTFVVRLRGSRHIRDV